MDKYVWIINMKKIKKKIDNVLLATLTSCFLKLVKFEIWTDLNELIRKTQAKKVWLYKSLFSALEILNLHNAWQKLTHNSNSSD